jgi:AraC-like DNA-binding protein
MNRLPLAENDPLREQTGTRTESLSASMRGSVRIWADARFEGLAFEQVALAPGEGRARLHDDYAFVIMRSGRGVINSCGAEYQAHPGSGFLFSPDRVWTARAGSDALCYQTLHVSRHKLTTLADQLELTSIQLARLSGVHVLDSETSEAARKVWAVFEARSSVLERVARLVELAAMVASACRLAQTVDDEPRVSRVRTFLQEHLSEHIEISRLAEIVSLSRCHLIRVFHRAVGVSLYRYVTLFRISHAVSLLRAGVPIAEAAGSAGFYDQSHLSRYFRRILGVTPGQYQKAGFFRKRPVITCERVMAYRLRSGEKLVLHWAKLRSDRGYASRLYPH